MGFMIGIALLLAGFTTLLVHILVRKNNQIKSLCRDIEAQSKNYTALIESRDRIHEQWLNELDFRAHFICRGDIQRNDLALEVIDRRLSELALEFHKAVTEEVAFQVSNEDDMQREMFIRQTRVEKAKKAFWDAHAAAKALGFAVGKKYADYLPAEVRQELAKN